MSPTPEAWVLVDQTGGATCQNGDAITPLAMARLAEAFLLQMNGEVADEYGGAATMRIASAPTDVKPGELVMALLATFPNEPDASAYHDVAADGVPDGFCAVTTCVDLYGPNGVGCDLTHEGIETRADPGCNEMCDDNMGTLHMREPGDPVEVQTYVKTCQDGTEIHVSNFVLKSWFIPGAAGPYDYMTKAGLAGAVAPPGPMQSAPSPGGQGNYQIVEPSNAASEHDVFAKHGGRRGKYILGTPKKPAKAAHAFSRARRCGVGRRDAAA